MLALVGLCAAGIGLAASPDPSMVPKIQAATFEVVIPKATDDPLTYEKPLPLDLLPYQERTDKFHSIGTAFAIGKGRYVTAGHVILAGIASLSGPPALRDVNGHVFAIDKIEKFSLQQDFVVFSLKQSPGDGAFDLDTKPAMNDVVYAVGNALGTGVVIRDGLYTSDTPEDENGRWKWMRFSAAASPGNSGGPLLDKDGKVIGVVLMKSANENLNYALPISEVLNAPDNVGVMDKRVSYQLDILDDNQNGAFKQQFSLPKSFAEFDQTYQTLTNDYAASQLKTLLTAQAAGLFPRGAGSNRLLHEAPSLSEFPTLMVRNNTGVWNRVGREANRVPLSANGYIAVGGAGHNVLLHLRRPDDVPADRFYNDSKIMLDLVLKTGYMNRQVGSEKIKITSMGEPVESSTYTDTWQRHWQVRVWLMPYINAKLVVFSLPVPDGYSSMMRLGAAAEEYDSMLDMKAITDYFVAGYNGTLAQWKDYLAQTSLLPTALRKTKVDADYGKQFNYSSPRITFDYPSTLQTVAANNRLELGFGYYGANDSYSWEAGNIGVRLNDSDPDRFDIRRHLAPTDDLDDTFKDTWRKMVHKQHPYDSVAYADGDEMDIATVINPSGSTTPTELYTVGLGTQGAQAQAAVKAKLDTLTQQVKISNP